MRTVPAGGVDTISIFFSEDVNVTADSLMVVGLTTSTLPQLSGFVYQPWNLMATWIFDGWARGDQYVLALADTVTDVDGNHLDGEWTNPASLSTVNAAVSEFPSGDGQPGGWFNFVMTLLPGDANADGVVDGLDTAILSTHYGTTMGAVFSQGDFNGDGAVDSYDLDLFAINNNADLQQVQIHADLDSDGDVDADDIAVIDQNGNMTGATWANGDLNGDGAVTLEDLDLAFALYGIELDIVS